MTNKFWGYHLILDCSGCNDNIKSKEEIETFTKTLIDMIGMVAHGEPIIEYLLEGTDNSGYSLMQMITTSNVCAHFVDKNNTAYIDIFSCKEFDNDVAERVVRTFFSPKSIRKTFLTRQA